MGIIKLNVEECQMVSGGTKIYSAINGTDHLPRYFVPGRNFPYKNLGYVRRLDNGKYEDADIVNCATIEIARSRAMQDGAKSQGNRFITDFFQPPVKKRICFSKDYSSPM